MKKLIKLIVNIIIANKWLVHLFVTLFLLLLKGETFLGRIPWSKHRWLQVSVPSWYNFGQFRHLIFQNRSFSKLRFGQTASEIPLLFHSQVSQSSSRLSHVSQVKTLVLDVHALFSYVPIEFSGCKDGIPDQFLPLENIFFQTILHVLVLFLSLVFHQFEWWSAHSWGVFFSWVHRFWVHTCVV